jgi:hypothetical protein
LVGGIGSVTRHRNGISGSGFYVIEFEGAEAVADLENYEPRRFVATVFDTPGDVAILSLEPESGTIDVDRRWRGDNFEPELRKVIASYEARVLGGQS